MAYDDAVKHERVSTGVRGLDEILHGGLLRNRLYLLQGDPGTGKTTIALQFLMRSVQNGEPCLYITLSETTDDLHGVASSHGWSLEGLNVCDLTASEDSLRAEAQYTVFHPSEVELGETTASIVRELERVQPVNVVFDGLSEVRLLARDPLRYRRQMIALKQYFADKAITVMLLDDQSTPLSDIQPESVVSGVITLEHHTPVYGGSRRRMKVKKMRGSNFISGYHDYEIKRGGITAHPRLISADHRPKLPEREIRSGITGLDAMLKGGLAGGTTTLIIGPAGVGKSTVALQYVTAAMQEGIGAAVYTFDEVLPTLFDRAEKLCPGFAEMSKTDKLHVAQVDPAELSPGAFAQEVRRAVEERGAGIVVIDSLNGYTSAMPEDSFLATHLHELFSYLNQRRVITILVVAQHGLVAGPEAAADISYLADTVLLMRYFEYLGEVRQAVGVFKKRTGPHERTLRQLTIGSDGVKIGEPLRDFQGIMTGVPQYGGANRGTGSGEHETAE